MTVPSLVIMASGRGSNAQAILDRIEDGYIPATCAAVITDNPDAYVIERARTAGVPVSVVPFRSFPNREAYEDRLIETICGYDPDLVVLAGYMRILGSGIVRMFAGRMINIHPSLLPAFSGLHAQEQAIRYGVKVAGCTVHFVTEEMDAGPVIIQRTVPVLDGDTGETLAGRILEEEHTALPEAVRLFCEHRLEITGRLVRVLSTEENCPSPQGTGV